VKFKTSLIFLIFLFLSSITLTDDIAAQSNFVVKLPDPKISPQSTRRTQRHKKEKSLIIGRR